MGQYFFDEIAHAKGELTLKTAELLEAPPEIDAKSLVAIREQGEVSRHEKRLLGF